jgi:hypothetical protein
MLDQLMEEVQANCMQVNQEAKVCQSDSRVADHGSGLSALAEMLSHSAGKDSPRQHIRRGGRETLCLMAWNTRWKEKALDRLHSI